MRSIIPPIIAKRIEDNVEPARKFRARKARLLTEKVQKKREGGPTAIEPQAGEQREVRDGANQEKTDGPVIRAEDSPDLDLDYAANAIYDAEGIAFAFYKTVFGRGGPSGDGRKQIAIARFGDQWDNAAFDGEFMLVGEGDIFPPLWKARAIIWHERGHEHTAAANGLAYRNWPGHLNESGSDIDECLTEMWALDMLPADYDWLIGRELFSEGLHGRALRDMRRKRNGPAFEDAILGKDPQYVDMDDFVERSDPHLGSSIPNGAFAEACIQHGGKAWLEMGHLHYDVWNRMNPASTGPQYAQMILDLAIERFGLNSKEYLAWAFGFDYVKLRAATGPAPAPNPEPEGSPCQLTPEEIGALSLAIVRTVQAHPAGMKLLAVARRMLTKEPLRGGKL